MAKRIALITGGMGGLGETISIKMADAGYRVAVTYSPSNKASAQWLQDMTSKGYEFSAYPCDVTDYESCAACVKKVTAEIGPVDILAKDHAGASVAIEIKRRGEIDGVEQLTRYLELMNRDPLLAPVTGVFAAQVIKPQARTLAEDRGIRCVVLDYDALRGIDDAEARLF